jgi:hypothetical protein
MASYVGLGAGAGALPPQNQCVLSVEGVPTDIICTSYADRHFVVISQLQKFGTLVTTVKLCGFHHFVFTNVSAVAGPD